MFSHFSHGSSGGGGSHGSSGGGSHGQFSHFSHGSSGGGGSHGSSGGGSHGLFSHRSHGSSGGSNGSAGGSYGSAGGYYVSANDSAAPAGYYTASTPSTATAGYYVETSAAAAPSVNVGYLNVSVPADAKVYLQDQLMTVTGTQRRFVTPELTAGVQHVYTVKVEVVRNGQTVTKTTQATIAAGQEVAVSVAIDAQNQQDLTAPAGSLASL
jgi:uncharacterized protein (TIGR03000 family)